MPEFVKIINKNTKPFDFHQNNRKRVLQPGEDAIIPWGLACSLFGHPSTLNVHPQNERDKLYNKVRARFNHTLGMVPPEAMEQGIRDSEQWWEIIRPRIEIFDIENNEQIWMVIDDPDGQHMSQPPKQTAGSEDIAVLMNHIQSLTAQVHKLTQQQTSNIPDPASSGGSQAPTPTSDNPAINPAMENGSPDSAIGFGIPITHPDVMPSEDSDVPPTFNNLDLASIAAQAQVSVDDPQAVPSGDTPPKMPPRPGS